MTVVEKPPRSEDPAGTVRALLFVSLLGTLLWLAAIFLAPGLESRGSSRSAGFLYALFSPTCHQMPERCFSFRGYPLAVCGRCLGVYAGFLAGLVAYPFVRGISKLELPRARTFLWFSVPIGVDGLAGILGIWASPIGVRFATGVLWGTILPFYFITGVAELVVSRKARARARLSPGAHQAVKTAVEKPSAKGVE